MTSTKPSLIAVRDAAAEDIPALVEIKGEDSQALHRDRLRDAQGEGFRYLVITLDQAVVGLACLVYRRPASWLDGGDTRHLPQIVDLLVKEALRGRGLGSALVREMETIAASVGCERLYLAVDPLDNPRAYALYQRLGYQQEQAEPYRAAWAFTDSAGQRHHGEDWILDMVKKIR